MSSIRKFKGNMIENLNKLDFFIDCCDLEVKSLEFF